MKENKPKKHNRYLRILAAMLAIIVTFSYMPAMEANAASSKGKIKSVTVTDLPAKTLTLKKGKSKTLKVEVTKTGKISTAVTFKSSQPKVATVTSKGKVTAKKNGTTKITIASKADTSKKTVITVTVGTPVTKLTLNKSSVSVKVGKTVTLKATVTPKKVSNKNVVWSSSNTKIATVTSKGVVKGIKAGTAQITATAADGSGKTKTATVIVGTPVTKITLNKSSVSVLTGNTVTLKATVTPKKASNKNVVWSSSDTKVATVTNKGVVKGIKAGTAKITATAADGSGKKVTATVTVVDPVVLQSVSVVNASTIKVDLSGAKALSTANFVVKLNKTGKGNYNKVCKVDNVVTTNNTSYLVVLDSAYTINDQENVQVTVSGLDKGNASLTTVYSEGTFKYTSAVTYSETYNERISRNFYLSGTGYCESVVTGLPSGIKVEDHGTYIRFYGIPKQKGKVTSQIVSMDELGNTYTNTITWLITSEDTISANAEPSYYLLGATGKVSVNEEVSVSGGSGSYIYSLSGTTYGLTIDSDYGEISGELMAAGTYTLTVNVQDRNNAAYKTTTNVVINVSSTVSVSGIVKDLSGNPIPYAEVYYSNKDKASKYSRYGYASSSSTGAFSMSIASGTYDIEASYNDSHRYLYSQALTTTRSGFDITLPLQKVVVYSNNQAVDAQNFGTWYDADGESYGSGNVFWLKVGKYTLTSTSQVGGRQTITATVNLDVTEKQSVVATAAVTVTTEPAAGTITAEQPISVSITDKYKYYAFTPATDGRYYFYPTENTASTYVCLEEESGTRLRDDYWFSSYNNGEYFSYTCTAGKTYYIGIKKIYSGSATAKLHVSTTYPEYDDDDDDYDDYMLQDIQSEVEANGVSDVEENSVEEKEDVVAEIDLPEVEVDEATEADEATEVDETTEADEAIEADEEAEADEAIEAAEEAEVDEAIEAAEITEV